MKIASQPQPRTDRNLFTATMSFEMDGHLVEAHISGEVQGKQMDGNISLQNAPPLSFTGSKAD